MPTSKANQLPTREPLNRKHSTIARQKIQTTMIVTRLQNHLAGKCDLSTTQVQAARILLDRTIPTLTSTELTGRDGKDLAVHVYSDPKDLRA